MSPSDICMEFTWCHFDQSIGCGLFAEMDIYLRRLVTGLFVIW